MQLLIMFIEKRQSQHFGSHTNEQLMFLIAYGTKITLKVVLKPLSLLSADFQTIILKYRRKNIERLF